ncbi:phage portal protein, HK97 family [Desulfitobacterium hafniense DCB-2]|uniref:Phage portal protein, HK97 family n=1 Tax=Desulfitobacterium hafniense (strain DSM 10664 / DCB-2) TaxID=272564 RepID=B8FNY5_DESHD|nr:phage portal protein [Desulfitobacterium hafniense]ACL19510.1 phage portal protein, HK97 family [Desulfitobacterium hafniense DCB-2]
MGLFRDSYETRNINGYSNDEFMRLLGINNLSVNKDKLSEITYFICIKTLSEAVAKLPLKLFRETQKGTEKAVGHYLYSLLKLRPNPYMSAWNFWTTIEFQKNHFGNSICYIDMVKSGRDSGKVKGLYILDHKNVQIWVDDAGLISKDNAVWYIYTDNNGKEYKLCHDQILHFRSAISLDGITGLAIQDILKMSIENAQNGQKFINTYWKQGMFSKGLLQYTGDIGEKAMKTMQSKFESMANGISNAGRILPVPLGFNFTTLDNKLVDSQFLELSMWSARQISAAFGIKPNQLNMEQKYSNMELNQREFYLDTLLPVITAYESELTWKLLTEQERNEGMFFKFNVDAILRADFETRMKGYGIAIDKGFMTPNEVREKEDLPTDPDGDKLLVNGTYIPLSMVGQQYTNAPLKGGENIEE